MSVQAVRIGVDGVATVVDLGEDQLIGLRREIGCSYVDVVRMTSTLDMWIDDEGAVVAEPQINHVAGQIAKLFDRAYQPYCGVVVFAFHDGEGDTIALSDEARDFVLYAAAAAKELVASLL